MSQKKPGNETENTADLMRRVRQLEFVIDHLQQRIAQIAGSYELEVAIAKSETYIEQQYGSPEED